MPNHVTNRLEIKADSEMYCTPKVGHFWGVFYEI